MGLDVVDVSIPVAPRRIGQYDNLVFGLGVVVAGNHAFVVDDWNGLHVIDVSDPGAPRRAGGAQTFGFATGVVTMGNCAFVANGGAGLAVFDIAPPPDLQLEADGNSLPFRVRVSGMSGLEVRVERSTKLNDWHDWKTLILDANPVLLDDFDAVDSRQRFYRASTAR